MEFLRLGSSIPGSYWGCCAVDIIQNFNKNPAEKASIELVDGDGGTPLGKFVGLTYEEIFWQRLRFGTFSSTDMPNHGFIAVLTLSQVSGTYGKQWLAILHKAGFEFIRAVDNSVYTGKNLCDQGKKSSHPNYIFGLFRNCGAGSIDNPFAPPTAWTDLGQGSPQPWDYLGYTPDDRANNSIEWAEKQREDQLTRYKALPAKKWYTQEELKKLGVPVHFAGKRSKYPQQEATERAYVEKAEAEAAPKVKSINPFTKDAA